MKYEFHASFDTLEEMLNFTKKLGKNTAGSNFQAVMERIDTMANTEVAAVIAQMEAGFASLNAAQDQARADAARQAAATDRLLALAADMPARIQAAVAEAQAAGVDPAQIASLTALAGAVQTEVSEAQAEVARVRAEADRVEAAAPAPAPVNVSPGPANPNPEPVQPAPVINNPDPGADTTGGGEPAPTPAPTPAPGA